MQNSSSNWFLRESFWSRLLPCCTTPISWMMPATALVWGIFFRGKCQVEIWEVFRFPSREPQKIKTAFFGMFWASLEDMNYLVMPATHFFSLPDYIFQDLRTVVGTDWYCMAHVDVAFALNILIYSEAKNTKPRIRGEIHLQDCFNKEIGCHSSVLVLWCKFINVAFDFC